MMMKMVCCEINHVNQCLMLWVMGLVWFFYLTKIWVMVFEIFSSKKKKNQKLTEMKKLKHVKKVM